VIAPRLLRPIGAQGTAFDGYFSLVEGNMSNRYAVGEIQQLREMTKIRPIIFFCYRKYRDFLNIEIGKGLFEDIGADIRYFEFSLFFQLVDPWASFKYIVKYRT